MSKGGAGADSANTPLFQAQNAERYARQALIREYEALTGAQLIVMIDQIFVPGADRAPGVADRSGARS